MKKKIIYISISIFLLIAVILILNTTSKNKIYINENNIEDNKNIAIYIEQENGSYNKRATFPTKEESYTLNTSKSFCNGNTNISWDKEEWGLELSNIDREETQCYLYFDIYVPTASETILENIIINENTPDFSKAAKTDEGIYQASDGMYGGTSYYWRGAVTDNYLTFAGKCWRIIRINGDGSIRMIYDGSTCHANGSNSESIAVESIVYNSSMNNPSYVGWTYTVNSQRPEPATETASNAKTQLESWYDEAITGTNADKVADGKYCNDRNAANGNWTYTGGAFNYKGYSRLALGKDPTLSCDENDVYTLKVGLITADEVAYAGGVYGTDNTSYYLHNNQSYWTMTPYNWTGGNAYVIYVHAYGSLANNNSNSVYKPYGLRPVINLKSDISISSGDGSQSNPYIVE